MDANDSTFFFAVADQAEDAPKGPAKVELWQQAVAAADTLNNETLGYEARMRLTDAAQFSGRPDVAFVAFSWCLAYSDRHPELEDPSRLLWHYKWMVDTLPRFPDVPKAQIEAMFADFTGRYLARGSTLHAVHQIRRDAAATMHDVAAAAAADRLFRKTRRDHLSNCDACVQDAEVAYRLFLGDDAAALKAAAPILRGRLTCGEVPHRTYPKLLLPHLRRGDPEAAMALHKVGYPMVKSNPTFLGFQGLHAAFAALTGNHGRAAQILGRHLPTAPGHPEPDERFRFYNAARLTVDLLLATPRPPEVKIPPAIAADGSLGAFAAWLDAELSTLAAKYDARNGNDGYACDIARMQAVKQFATRCPFKATL